MSDTQTKTLPKEPNAFVVKMGALRYLTDQILTSSIADTITVMLEAIEEYVLARDTSGATRELHCLIDVVTTAGTLFIIDAETRVTLIHIMGQLVHFKKSVLAQIATNNLTE